MKPIIILGIETSCDETSIAVVNDTKVLSHVTASQIKRHEAYGGVFPELASRLHTENIGYVLQTAIKESKIKLEDLSAVAVTRGPGLIGALHIGLQTAKMLAARLQIPLIGVHHHAAHLEAARFMQPILYPALGLIVSGGHTELVYMARPLHYELIGQTQDDAIGESYDKVARMMGLAYPGGPILDQLTQKGKPQYTLPTPKATGKFDFSYSGLKTAVQSLMQKEQQAKREMNQANLAFAFQQTVIQTLIDKLQLALQTFPVKSVIIGGGVSLNQTLRKQANLLSQQTKIPFIFPPIWACTDNGAMIALLGGEMFKAGMISSLELGVDPSWDIQASMQK
ncbi:MAG: tRNA (adenosine(37)-N6)-threonylcarbamoyltransferase complex transferase subunit TsaD [Firmicutes bacterium]|nr:tRNA (adenosine(37)-N6)-threonylcarbamoyltransferase complex transferase subunit TsaD [Bacillota bacterium]